MALALDWVPVDWRAEYAYLTTGWSRTSSVTRIGAASRAKGGRAFKAIVRAATGGAFR